MRVPEPRAVSSNLTMEYTPAGQEEGRHAWTIR